MGVRFSLAYKGILKIFRLSITVSKTILKNCWNLSTQSKKDFLFVGINLKKKIVQNINRPSAYFIDGALKTCGTKHSNVET